jgi:hypothetical protein
LDYGSYGRIKRKMTIGKNTDVQKVGTKKDLGELAKLMILNILSVKGVIWTHYKNKRKEANEKKQKTKRKRLNETT